MRRLRHPVAISAPNVGGTSRALRANFPSKLALSSSSDGVVHVVDLNADGESLHALKSLPGHMDEVAWAFVDWGSERNEAIRACTISVERDVLFWDVAWSQLRLLPEEVAERSESDEEKGHPFWHPRRLTKGHQYRARVAAYDATARHHQISALTGSADGLVHCWSLDVMDHDHLHQYCSPLAGHTDQVTSLAADFGGDLALSGSCDKTLRMWNLRGQFCEGVLRGHQGSIRTMVADWTQKRAISTSMDSVHVWDLGPKESRDRRPTATLQVQSGVCETLAAFSAGSAAFVSRLGCIEFWDLDPSVRMYSLQCHPGTLFAVHLGLAGQAEAVNEHCETETEDMASLAWMGTLMPALAGSGAAGWSRTVL
ncbi:BRWD1 [Symbiodinium microadriaticum]|nr:BRWD1 [Symbiodinium microadriaticum]